jgi:uncharacterized Fe-S radical SAM superfamily protein PflX
MVPAGFELTGSELAEWMIKLQDFGNCHNINFVTPEHVAPQVVFVHSSRFVRQRQMSLQQKATENCCADNHHK